MNGPSDKLVIENNLLMSIDLIECEDHILYHISLYMVKMLIFLIKLNKP